MGKYRPPHDVSMETQTIQGYTIIKETRTIFRYPEGGLMVKLSRYIAI